MFGEEKEKYKSAEKLELKEIKKDFPKVFKEVCCPSCNNTVPADNLNLSDKVAKCGAVSYTHLTLPTNREV